MTITFFSSNSNLYTDRRHEWKISRAGKSITYALPAALCPLPSGIMAWPRPRYSLLLRGHSAQMHPRLECEEELLLPCSEEVVRDALLEKQTTAIAGTSAGKRQTIGLINQKKDTDTSMSLHVFAMKVIDARETITKTTVW